MIDEPRPKHRRREVHLYLREDILEALERVAADSGLSISQGTSSKRRCGCAHDYGRTYLHVSGSRLATKPSSILLAPHYVDCTDGERRRG